MQKIKLFWLLSQRHFTVEVFLLLSFRFLGGVIFPLLIRYKRGSNGSNSSVFHYWAVWQIPVHWRIHACAPITHQVHVLYQASAICWYSSNPQSRGRFSSLLIPSPWWLDLYMGLPSPPTVPTCGACILIFLTKTFSKFACPLSEAEESESVTHPHTKSGTLCRTCGWQSHQI